jgi:hypothetical protein
MKHGRQHDGDHTASARGAVDAKSAMCRANSRGDTRQSGSMRTVSMPELLLDRKAEPMAVVRNHKPEFSTF